MVRRTARHDDALKLFGRRITHVRKQLGITQAELAKKSGVSTKFLSMLEAGANVSVKTLRTLTNSLGVDLKDIVKAEKKKRRRPPLEVDERLQDHVSKELVRRLSLMTPEQRTKALKILRMAFVKS